MSVLKVFLADDHAILREGVAALVNTQDDMVVAGEAATATAAIDGCLAERPDVLVLDLSMPGGGLAVLERLSRELPSVKCIVLTMHDDPAHLRAVVAAGAKGYLIKAGVGSDLIEGIRQVARGKSFVRVSARAVKEEPQLSGREREVLILVARGHTNRAIAERLGVKPKTVETYRARLQDKLGVSGRAEIFAYAEREGLLDPARRELSSTQS
ncbi:MAG: response regulator transcription factor [Myxococcales bacterium]|nr:response regulator transcription factor [Myxococcales bacterium]